MATTPAYGLRYQTLADPPDGAALGQNLAEDVEAELARIDNTIGPVPTYTSDTGMLSTLAITPAAGWSLTERRHRIIGRVLYARVQLTRIGGTLTGDAAGNLADTLMGTLTNSAHWPQFTQIATVRCSSTAGTVQLSAANGQITLTDLHSGGVVAGGDNCQMNFTYPLP